MIFGYFETLLKKHLKVPVSKLFYFHSLRIDESIQIEILVLDLLILFLEGLKVPKNQNVNPFFSIIFERKGIFGSIFFLKYL